MENPQMGMPAEMAPQGPNPEEMAIYEQMRQQISPQEFSNEMLAGASQVDPQAVAEFTEELQSLDVSPEELDALNDLVDQILANPEQYDQLRQQFLAQGMPDDILPEQFDPYFFAALNMAVDQMIAAPTGVQAFAQGGIAELKPIAKAIASYGRNGDTMLAHITPAEARMLKRRGGSGTINPATGLPEFFLKKAFKSIGKAVKKFASSTVGRLVTTVALGFFLGPAAASFLGASSVAGVAAVSGFVGSAGSTLLAGGNLKDALKAGAIGGLTAGAGAGIMGGADAFASGSASTAGLTPGQAFQGQVDKFTGAFTPGATAQAPVPQAGAPAAGIGPDQMPVPAAPAADPLGNFIQQNEALRTAANTPVGGGAFDPKSALTDNVTTSAQRDAYIANQGLDKPPSLVDQAKEFYNKNISPSGIKAAGQQEAMSKTLAQFPNATAEQVMSAPANSVLGKAFASHSPGILSTYGPMAGAGLGIMGLAGGFDTKPVQGGPITQSLMKTADQRIREKGTQRQMYMQGLPGVVYDEFGAPVFGQSTRLPTYDVPDYDYGGFNMSGAGGQGGMDLPPVYVPPSGAMGSRQVAQPYNTSSMYSNLMAPQRYADGGQVQYFSDGGNAAKLPANFNWEQYVAANPDLGRAGIDTQAEAQEHWINNGLKENRALNPEEGAQREQARLATLAEQKAARDAVAQQKAMRRAAGSGSMYANINAGISALAPETNPTNSSDTGFGARNRGLRMESLEQTYGTMLQKQRDARALQERILTKDPTLTGGDSPITTNPVTAPPTTGPVTAPPTTGPVTAPPTTGPVTAPMPAYFTQNPDVAAAYRQDSYGMTPEQFAQTHFERYGRNEQRTAPGVTTPPTTTTTMPTTPPGEFFHYGIDEYGRGAGEGFGTAPPPGMQPIYQPVPGMPDTQTGGRPDPGPGAFYHYAPPTAGATNYSALTPAQIANTPSMGVGGIGLTALPGLTALDTPSMGVGGFGLTAAPGLTAYMNQGGIAGLAQGGYPRRNGQISGPGTEKSDSIPAMLSDGEFVLTAKAVRGADPTGKGSRRAGAKQMYKLMHQLEKNAERG